MKWLWQAPGPLRAHFRSLAVRSTSMLRVARRAERLAATLAILRVMPADFAVAPDTVSQERTHTSRDTAPSHRVDCVILLWGRHRIAPRDGQVSCRSVGQEVAFNASNDCISGAVLSVISLNLKAGREYAAKPSPSSVTHEQTVMREPCAGSVLNPKTAPYAGSG